MDENTFSTIKPNLIENQKFSLKNAIEYYANESEKLLFDTSEILTKYGYQ